MLTEFHSGDIVKSIKIEYMIYESLIQSGGGKGPMKPRQPSNNRV